MRLVFKACREVDFVRITVQSGVSGFQCPKVAYNERLAARVVQLSQEMEVVRIEHVYRAVAEVTDQEVVRERTKVGGRDGQPPRRVQWTA